MIVLDTNVVSELMKSSPSAAVVEWTSAQAATACYTTSITQAEILHGIWLLPKGKRRAELERVAVAMFAEDFSGRVLAFGSEATTSYAQIASARSRAGRPISQFDAQIAAIALLHRAELATRNIADFSGCGLRLINPWDAGSAARD
jgi:predicted nucleic acid-binding protein